MQIRDLGQTGISVGAVSVGADHLMHASMADTQAIVDLAIDRGVNYFDLVGPFPEFRDRFAAALRGRRDRVLLTCHLNAAVKNGQYWKTTNPDISRAGVEDFLARYHTDHIDVLFVHNVNGLAEYQALLRPGGIMELAHYYRREGIARCVGLSGHLSEVCIHPVRDGLIDVLMFPVNLSSHAEPGRSALLQACAEHGVGVVAMKAFGGGKLLQTNRTVQFARYQTGGPSFKKKVPRTLTPVRCLSYVLTQPAVATAVAGVANCAELEASLAYLSAGDEDKDFSDAIAGFEQYHTGECVYCNHCLPCPVAIDIGLVSRLVDTFTPALQARYDAMPVKASACTRCGACVKRCPFAVDILPIIDHAVGLYEARSTMHITMEATS
jgi:predicted aldo/keto reductase-like oxidoreductase